MPEPADRPPSLRDQLAETIRDTAHTCKGPECGCDYATTVYASEYQGRTDIEARLDVLADAVLPVLEAETAAQVEHWMAAAQTAATLLAEQAERDLAEAKTKAAQQQARAETAERQLAEVIEHARAERMGGTAVLRSRAEQAERRVEHFEEHAAQVNADLEIETQRAEEAERALAQARDAIATERRGRLAAEAAVRRAREVARNRVAVPSDVLREALTIEQPEEP